MRFQVRRLLLSRASLCVGAYLLLTVPVLADDADGGSVPADQGSPPTPIAESDLETARMHFKNGVDLLQQLPPNYQDAYRQFELAYEKSGGSWKVLGNWGLTALKLERDGEALGFYQSYLEQGRDEIDPGERSLIERELLLIKGNMATVSLELSDPSARIRVARQGSTAPPQLYDASEGKARLGLRAGTLSITAQSSEKRLTWEVTLSPGESAEHTFDFSAPAPQAPVSSSAAQSQTVQEAPPEPRKSNGFRTAGFVTAGVGIAALGGGLVTGLMSNSKEKKANEGADEICIQGVCPGSIEEDFDSAKTLATVANVLFIGGGVLAATGITLVIVGATTESHRESATLRLGPMTTRGGGGLLASGQF